MIGKFPRTQARDNGHPLRRWEIILKGFLARIGVNESHYRVQMGGPGPDIPISPRLFAFQVGNVQ